MCAEILGESYKMFTSIKGSDVSDREYVSHFCDFSFYIRLNRTGTLGFLGFQTRSETQDLFTST